MTTLSERYRPERWSDVVGQDEVVGRLKRLAHRGWLCGRAFWISGRSGTGKTTLARLIAGEVADPFCTTEVDAGTLTVAELVELEGSLHLSGMGDKPGRCLICNESHGLRRPVVRYFLTMLERLPRHATIIFTTTSTSMALFEDANEDATPLISRCLRLELAESNLSRPFAERVKLIAELEGLDGLPLERYLTLARKCSCNLRAMLNEVEAGTMLADQEQTSTTAAGA